MNILVTGATGCLGRNLIPHLTSIGLTVTATGRNPSIGKELEMQGARFVPALLENEEAISSLCKGQDTVFHCGALSSPWGKYHDFYKANVLGTEQVIKGCMKHQVARLIHISTPSIYFDFTHRMGIKETDPLPRHPVNHYAATKLLAEAAIDRAFLQGLPVITLRPRAIIGPHDNAIMPRIIRAAYRGKVPVIDGGNAVIDVTYVGNVIESMMLAMNAPEKSLGEKYNITNDEPVRMIDLLRKTFDKLGIPFLSRSFSYPTAHMIASLMECSGKILSYEPVMTRYSAGLLAFNQTLDISHAKEDLHYHPAISLDEAITRYSLWWRQQHG